MRLPPFVRTSGLLLALGVALFAAGCGSQPPPPVLSEAEVEARKEELRQSHYRPKPARAVGVAGRRTAR